MDQKPVMLGRIAKGVVDALQQGLDNGSTPPGGYLGTENELARRHGVSRTSVRLALRYLMERGLVERGEAQGVKGFLATSAPVTSAIPPALDAPLGTVGAFGGDEDGAEAAASPSAGEGGQNTSGGPEKRDLLLLRAGDNLFVNEVFAGAMASPWAAAFQTTLLDGTGTHGNYVDLLENLPARYGHLLLPPLDFPEVKAALEKLVERGVRMVQMDRYLEGLRAPAVMPDHYAMGVEGTRHLIAEHGRPVYYLGNFRQPTSAAMRFEGWKAEMHRHGFDNWKSYVIGREAFERTESDYTTVELADAGVQAFLGSGGARDGQPASVLCINDVLGLRVYRLCERLGLDFRGHFRLVAAGGFSFTEKVDPPLTTLAIDWRLIGAESMRLLAEGREEFVCAGWRKLLPARLVVRESSLSEASLSAARLEAPALSGVGT